MILRTWPRRLLALTVGTVLASSAAAQHHAHRSPRRRSGRWHPPELRREGRRVQHLCVRCASTPAGITQTYRYDRSSGVTTLVSRNAAGDPVGANVRGVSSSGRFLLIEGGSADYGFAVNPFEPEGLQSYLYDARRNTVTLVTRARDQEYSSRIGVEYADAVLAAGGRQVAYTSTARDTASNRVVEEYLSLDVFLWSR